MRGGVWTARRIKRIAAMWSGSLVLMIVALPGQDPPAQPFVAPPAPAQPIAYSHKQHLALGLECRQCHVNPEAGTLMTYPATAICMSCHQAIAADRPAIQKLAGFAASGTPVPWVRVYAVPDYVFWSHGAHLNAKVACAECHGDVAKRDVIFQETDVVTMLGCRRCHDQRQVFTDCGDCHEPRQ